MNILYIQDFSRATRLKFKVKEKPYVLDTNNLLELGGLRCRVKARYPRAMFPKICDEYLYIPSQRLSFPIKNIFMGELGPGATSGDSTNYEFYSRPPKDFLDIYIRKADFRFPDDLKAGGKNPYIDIEVLEGPNTGQIWHIEKNLNYQLKQLEKNFPIPTVKTEFLIGKDPTCDFVIPLSTSRKEQCTIFYSEIYGWCLREDSPWIEIGNNYIFGVSYDEYKEMLPSRLIQVQDSMQLCVGDHEFSCRIKNLDKNMFEGDIYDNEASLMLENHYEQDDVIGSNRYSSSRTTRKAYY